ncbi:related to ketopantoate reductase [Saccharomycodes ludwigii]|uniref:Related to ketopantoate reductase n=1 Tax=Saccharomycodes ludwigii TaxID=36035 RepID=A0A376B4X8_9ASCO|nr:hypothetical protein SCDLUD_000262 [Saccharomycodes ludwigii]KAH3902679.1 hypothetical protein SCDLUD_000262 [Saccharomycodes ludwigii]SSD59746.1 related to ketopantoate reductase [Saccharomycodes ludwigii]
MFDKLPHCLVIGAGGVGVITAYSLFIAGKCIVSIIARSDYDIVKTKGYNINSCDYGNLEGWKPHHCYKSVEAAAMSGEFFDYIIVTTKNIPDGPTPVSRIIEPVIESNLKLCRTSASYRNKVCNIVLIQNGIYIENEIIELLETMNTSSAKVSLISGVQLIASTKVGSANIIHKNTDHLTLGAFDPNDKTAVAYSKKFIEMYKNEGKNYVELDTDAKYTRWKKLLYNATINTTTALTSLDFSRCVQFGPETTEFGIVKPAMQEVIAIAKSEGVIIDEKLIDFFYDITLNLVYKPSMCVDVQKGQLMELEVILGNPIRVAAKNEVKVPHLNIIYNLLLIIQGKIKESRGLLVFDEKTARVVKK